MKQTTSIIIKKIDTLPTQPVFQKDFSQVSILKILQARTNHLCYGTMLFIMCHFSVKAIAFFELVKAISLSILFTFQISAKKLFIFMSFFSLDLCTYNLNISRMGLLRSLLFSKIFSRNPKMTDCGVEVGKIKLF